MSFMNARGLHKNANGTVPIIDLFAGSPNAADNINRRKDIEARSYIKVKS